MLFRSPPALTLPTLVSTLLSTCQRILGPKSRIAHRRHPKIDDSDRQSADEDSSDIFDIAKDEYSSDTDTTSIEDLYIDDVDVDDKADIKDQIALFSRNIYLLEYYCQAVKDFNKSAFNCKDYSLETTLLLNTVKE